MLAHVYSGSVVGIEPLPRVSRADRLSEGS